MRRRSIRFDTLNKVLLGLAVLFLLLARSGRFYIFAGIAITLFALRAFSSDDYARAQENDKFTGFFSRIKSRFTSRRAQNVRPVRPTKSTYDKGNNKAEKKKKAKRPRSDRENKVFKCPNCKTYLRVPRGKGKIVITCTNCGEKIEKKT